jgi:hypothetical protein
MARRTREFDRSTAFGDLLNATVPHGMVSMPTNDAWRNQRRLVGDTMSPQFIQFVAAPQEEKAFNILLKLWHEKVRLAAGHPFQIGKDIDGLLLDVIFAVVFGSTTGAVETSHKLLADTARLQDIPASQDSAVQFPEAPRNKMHHATELLALSSEIGIKSPFGVHHHRFALKWYPSLVEAGKVKEQFMTEKLNEAWKKFNRPEASEDDIKSAVDLVVAREVKLAAKQNRKPEYDSRSVRDELFTIIIGGWDTSASAVKWSMHSNFARLHACFQLTPRRPKVPHSPPRRARSTPPKPARTLQGRRRSAPPSDTDRDLRVATRIPRCRHRGEPEDRPDCSSECSRDDTGRRHSRL